MTSQIVPLLDPPFRKTKAYADAVKNADKDRALQHHAASAIVSNSAIVESGALAIAAINNAHLMVRESVATAVQHGIRCGQLLLEQKARLKHGNFCAWIDKHCDFQYSTAARYMRAAEQNSTGVEISNLSGLFPSGRAPKAAPAIEQAAKPLLPAPEPGSIERAAKITVNEAVDLLELDSSKRQIVSTYKGWRGKVNQLRNQLAKAEVEFAEAEKALLKAAIQKRGES